MFAAPSRIAAIVALLAAVAAPHAAEAQAKAKGKAVTNRHHAGTTAHAPGAQPAIVGAMVRANSADPSRFATLLSQASGTMPVAMHFRKNAAGKVTALAFKEGLTRARHALRREDLALRRASAAEIQAVEIQYHAGLIDSATAAAQIGEIMQHTAATTGTLQSERAVNLQLAAIPLTPAVVQQVHNLPATVGAGIPPGTPSR